MQRTNECLAMVTQHGGAVGPEIIIRKFLLTCVCESVRVIRICVFEKGVDSCIVDFQSVNA